MSITNTRAKLVALAKQIDELGADAAPEIKTVVLQPGESLPPGATPEDYNFIVRLSDAAHPRSQR